MTWLDRKRRRALMVPVYVPGGSGASEIHLVTFSKGYAQPPVVQKFESIEPGAAMSYNTYAVSLDDTDANGLTRVAHHYERVNGGDVLELTVTFYNWNGRRFVKQPNK